MNENENKKKGAVDNFDGNGKPNINHLSFLKTHYLSEPPSSSVVGFLKRVGIKIENEVYKNVGVDFERGVLTLFCTMHYHDGKMYNTVVPPKMLLHKNNTKKLKIYLWIFCIYS